MELTEEIIKQGLGCMGRHPILRNHYYLELNISGYKNIVDISLIKAFKHIIYLDISNNNIEDLSDLSELSYLIQIDARDNSLRDCLNFCIPLCNSEVKWSTGHKALGSLITSANFSNNLIEKLNDLSNHTFLEFLLLSKNQIEKIEGVSNLKNLKVLDLSYNKITVIEGLEGLNIQELNLEGNSINEISGIGIEQLPRLTTLNLAKNQITRLKFLKNCENLEYLDLRSNEISIIRQVEFLGTANFLQTLFLLDNPCYQKPFYRQRVITRIPNLQKLDFTKVTSDERISSANAYPTSRSGDLEKRIDTFNKYFPGEDYVDYSPILSDDEIELNDEELERGIRLAEMRSREAIKDELIKEFDAVNKAKVITISNSN